MTVMPALADSHCHLDYETDLEKQEAIVRRAFDNGVTRLATIGTRFSTACETVGIAERYPFVWAVVGVHPEYADEEQTVVTVDGLCALARHPKVVGFGETGLDYHYNAATAAVQKELFRLHLKAAKKAGLPVVIHTRDADEDTIDVLESEADSNLRGVLHCFSSGEKLARTALDMGFYISASGILTFNKSDALRDIFKKVPLERLLVETDAPYLYHCRPQRERRTRPSFRSVAVWFTHT